MSNPLRHLIFCAFIITGASGTVAAQDFGSLIQSISRIVPRPANPADLVSVIQSISEVSTGTIGAGAQLQQDTNGKVVLYRTASCPFCIQAAAYMQQRQIQFVERDVGRNRAYNAEMNQLGGKGVPFMVMGNKTLVGFSESSFRQSYAQFQSSQASAAAPAPDYPAGSTMPANVYPPSSTRPIAATIPADLRAGDPFISKIAGVPVYQKPGKSGMRIMTLARSEEVIFMGEERDGMIRVTSGKGEGWVDRLLMKRQ